MSARGLRNNNAGNLDFNPRAFRRDPWLGEVGLEPPVSGSRRRFTTFEHPIFGLRALCRVLVVYHRYRRAGDNSRIDTVQEFIDRWAPPADNNNTDAYARAVRWRMGVQKGEVIDLEDVKVLAALASAIVRHENGSNPYSLDIMRAAALMALY